MPPMENDPLTLTIAAAAIAALIGLAFGILIARRRAVAGTTGAVAQQPAATDQAQTQSLTKTYEDHPAYRTYLQFLISKNVPTREIDSRMRDFAEQLETLRLRLGELKDVGDETAAIADSADKALGDGDFERATELFVDLGEREQDAGLAYVKRSEKHLLSAATVLSVAGDLHMARLNYNEAKASYTDAITAFPTSRPIPAEYHNKLGTAAFHAGDQDLAIQAFEATVRILDRTDDANQQDLATALNNLGLLHYARKNFDEAETLYQRALEIDEKALGSDHSAVATDLNNLALLYKRQKRLEEAEPLFARSLAIKEKVLPPGHASLTTGLKNYASLLRALDRTEEAVALEKRAASPLDKRSEAAA